MALIYLLDTNILSEPIRKIPHAPIASRIQKNAGSLAIAATTWHEMLFGVFRMPKSHKRTIIEQYLYKTVQAEVSVLPFDAAAAEWFAAERARLSQLGRPPSFPDGQIAAIAATNNLILVTRNVSDFSYFDGLEIENWFVS